MVNKEVPIEIVSDELMIFCSLINYLANACIVSVTGFVHLVIYVGRNFPLKMKQSLAYQKKRIRSCFVLRRKKTIMLIIIHVSIQTWKISYNVVFFVFKLDWDCTVLRATNNNSVEDDMISSLGRDREKGSLKVSTQAWQDLCFGSLSGLIYSNQEASASSCYRCGDRQHIYSILPSYA